jgi:predicted SprT family Zn-dependent metalloprotease
VNLADAKQLAEDLMAKHLDNPEMWTFDWERSVTAHGATYYVQRKIKMSRVVTEAETEDNVRDTILHEIAHANVWDRTSTHGHTPVWKREARRLGAVPTLEGSGASVDIRAEKAPWVGHCPTGHTTRYRYWRKPRATRSCGDCSPGRFSPAHIITYTKEA